ncbi:MAG: CCC motif membrane protein [Bacteroidetes bacterium]|nr:CCC motif membrane protein [Bacteroidota bacterium]
MENQETPNLEKVNQQFNQQFGQQIGQKQLPNATAVLVLGIISIVGCFCYGIIGLILGIIAVILAVKDNNLYNLNPTLYTVASYKNLKAGRVCAIIGLSLSALYVIFWIIFFVIVGSAALGSNPFNMIR